MVNNSASKVIQGNVEHTYMSEKFAILTYLNCPLELDNDMRHFHVIIINRCKGGKQFNTVM